MILRIIVRIYRSLIVCCMLAASCYATYSIVTDDSHEPLSSDALIASSQNESIAAPNLYHGARQATNQSLDQATLITGYVRDDMGGPFARHNAPSQRLRQVLEIFAPQLDWVSDAHSKDYWKILEVHGQVIAAQYISARKDLIAIRNPSAMSLEYATLQGQCWQGEFLRSPLQYKSITSDFTPSRFHPILHHMRPHWGIDYEAPLGTPVRSLGHGVIHTIGYFGSAGTMVAISHPDEYVTKYMHLMRTAAHISVGTTVKKGDVIGYVGDSGRATGPHLHFELIHRNVPVNPKQSVLMMGRQLAGEELLRFNAFARTILPRFSGFGA